MLLDKKEFRKRVLLRLLSSPLTLIPFVLGTTVLLGVWALGLEAAGLWMFLGICSMLGALGVCITRIVLFGEQTGNKVIEKMRSEMQSNKEKTFDALAKELQKDKDPRTEQYLKDLRTLTARFTTLDTSVSGSTNLDAYSSFEIAAKVAALFDKSVGNLQKSLELWKTAQSLESAKARGPLLDLREKLIIDVGKSIEQLGVNLAEIQRINAGTGDASSGLENLRAELDDQISTADKVNDHMDNFESSLQNDISSGKYDEYLDVDNTERD